MKTETESSLSVDTHSLLNTTSKSTYGCFKNQNIKKNISKIKKLNDSSLKKQYSCKEQRKHSHFESLSIEKVPI